MQVLFQQHLIELVLDGLPVVDMLSTSCCCKWLQWAVDRYVMQRTRRIRVGHGCESTQFRGRPHSIGDRWAVLNNGNKSWWRFGKLFRRGDQPAQQLKDGSRLYYDANQRLHRANGPAIVWCGRLPIKDHLPQRVAAALAAQLKDIWTLSYVAWPFQAWIQHGQLHCTNGPALTSKSGVEGWFQNGLLHRQGRPAVVINLGRPSYWSQERTRYEYWRHGKRDRAREAAQKDWQTK